jgi:hypothetical protein
LVIKLWGSACRADAEKIVEVVNSLELRGCLTIKNSMQRFCEKVKDIRSGAQAEGQEAVHPVGSFPAKTQ